MRSVLILLIDFYQRCLSPLWPPACRYLPTCSQYAKEALLTHGLVRGSFLSARRILRCNPLFPGGYDPVPEPRKTRVRSRLAPKMPGQIQEGFFQQFRRS